MYNKLAIAAMCCPALRNILNANIARQYDAGVSSRSTDIETPDEGLTPLDKWIQHMQYLRDKGYGVILPEYQPAPPPSWNFHEKESRAHQAKMVAKRRKKNKNKKTHRK